MDEEDEITESTEFQEEYRQHYGYWYHDREHALLERVEEIFDKLQRTHKMTTLALKQLRAIISNEKTH